MKAPRVGVIGIGQSEYKARRPDANYPELVREAVVLAMRDAKRELDEIEAVVYSLAPDALLGIGNAERLGVDAVGARNKRFMRINTGGSTGLSALAAAHSPTLSAPATRTRSQAPAAMCECAAASAESPVDPPVLMRMKRLLRAPTASTPSRSALPMPSSASGANE